MNMLMNPPVTLGIWLVWGAMCMAVGIMFGLGIAEIAARKRVDGK